MHVIRARNVAEALPTGVEYLLQCGSVETTRAGDAYVAPGPVTTVYDCPQERVLTSPVRDANPFFHLAEIAWMLAGRDDAALLNNFVADFGQRFAESASGKENWETDGRVHGAYGRRWRSELGFDQLDHVVETLGRDPTSRQCVIQMWDARPRQPKQMKLDGRDTILTSGCEDLRGQWLDRPCNTHVYLRIRDQEKYKSPTYGDDSTSLEYVPVLDVTVCCRSNDVIWGAYGANAVHFSALQEYLAARIGVGVGAYYQVSNNFHAYVAELDRLRTRSDCRLMELPDELRDDRSFEPAQLVDSPGDFDSELRSTLRSYENHELVIDGGDVRNKFLESTLSRALLAHKMWKSAQKHSAVQMAERIVAPDWRVACVEWMKRRYK